MTHDTHDPDEIIEEADAEREEQSELAQSALEWFMDDDRLGELIPRDDAVTGLAEALGVDDARANTLLGSLVGDLVDPVQQVMTGGDRYVGIIEYHVFEDDGGYGYVDYDDRLGRRKRVVCARCVEQYALDEHISHATQGEGSAGPDADWGELRERVREHIEAAHDVEVSTIEPGASLLSGTTVGGNTAWHAGNDGAGSGLNADSVDSAEPPFGLSSSSFTSTSFAISTSALLTNSTVQFTTPLSGSLGWFKNLEVNGRNGPEQHWSVSVTHSGVYVFLAGSTTGTLRASGTAVGIKSGELS